MSGVVIEDINLNVSDRTMMSAFVARPRGTEKHPGIFVFHEAYGVNLHIRDIAERFAKEGYVAIAPELFHRTATHFEGNYNDFEGTRKHIQALTTEGLIADIEAVNDWLRRDARILNDEIVSIGFCLGGRVSFLANTIVKLKAAISFYGSGIANLSDRVPQMQAPQLMFWGGLDKHIGEDQISAVTTSLKANNKNYVNVIISNADHGFFCDVRPSYNPDAAKQAWSLVTSFLNTYVKKD